MIRTISSAFLAVLMVGIASSAHAEYPEKPITYIVPYGAGGGTDIAARVWHPFMERCLGGNASIVVLNKPGGSSAVGTAELAKAAPDGYTFGTINLPNLYSLDIAGDVPWTIDSFEYVGALVGSSGTINVRADSPLKTIKDLIDSAKGKPINVGISSVGGDDHLTLMKAEHATGLKFNFIPLGDAPSSRNALIGGHIDLAGMSDSESAAFRDMMRPIAVSSEKRVKLWPDVATYKEFGFDVIGGGIHSIATPKGLPEEIRTKWQSCIDKIAVDPEFLAVAEKRSVSIIGLNAKATRDFIEQDEKVLQELWKKDPWIK